MKQRQANMELMRVASMLLVLLLHTLFLVNGRPSLVDFLDHPMSTFMYVEWEALALVCVDCFILISGYFGITLKKQSLFRFLFIVYFYRFAIELTALATGIAEFSIQRLLIDLYPLGDMWFIDAYLALLIFAPILNAYIDRAKKREFKRLLSVYVAFMVIIGSLWANSAIPFNSGYGVLSFIGLYLIGRFYRLYAESNVHGHKRYLLLYFVLCTLNATAYNMGAHIANGKFINYCATIFMSYDNALTLTASVCLMIYFSRLPIRSEKWAAKAICWAAGSAFSVYLINVNKYIFQYWKEACSWLMETYWPFVWPFAVIVFCICFYMACLLIDQVRLMFYRKTQQILFKQN